MASDDTTYTPIAFLQRPLGYRGSFFSFNHGVLDDYTSILAKGLEKDARNRTDFPDKQSRKTWAKRQAASDIVWLLQANQLAIRYGGEQDEIIAHPDSLPTARERLERFSGQLSQKLEPHGYRFAYELNTDVMPAFKDSWRRPASIEEAVERVLAAQGR